MAETTVVEQYKARPYDLDMVWLESPFFEHLLSELDATPEEKTFIRDFARDGYAVIDPGISERVIDAANADLAAPYDRVVATDPGNQRLQDAFKFSDNVSKIATSPKVMQILKLLYQREPIPFQTLNFRVGTQQMTHSDTIHFQSYPANLMCGVWLAMEDVDEVNGAVHYYPGSHRLPLYDLNTLGIYNTGAASYHVYELFVQNMLKHSPYERKIISLKKGQALVWAANLFHGGSPILDKSRTRLSQVTHYYFEGSMYYTPGISDPFMGQIAWRTDLTDVRTGKPLPLVHRGKPVDHRKLREPKVADATMKVLASTLVRKATRRVKTTQKG